VSTLVVRKFFVTASYNNTICCKSRFSQYHRLSPILDKFS